MKTTYLRITSAQQKSHKLNGFWLKKEGKLGRLKDHRLRTIMHSQVRGEEIIKILRSPKKSKQGSVQQFQTLKVDIGEM